jgi:hypothetical protein
MSMQSGSKSPLVPVLQRRVRSLTWLAGATGLAVVCALISQWQLTGYEQSDFKPVKMFPGLEDQAKANSIAAIQVETHASAFNVVRQADGKWVLPDKGNYPADFDQVRRIVTGLAELELVEPRTARADWNAKLGLAAPKDAGEGQGTVVTIKDAKGEVLASVVSGTPVEGASAGGKQAIYVRRPQDSQAYVARGSYQPATDVSQWLTKSFIDFPSDRMKTVSVKPFKGPSYTVTRATPQTPNFSVVERLPPGRSLRTPGEPNGVGNALIGMTYTDVAPQSGMNFANAAHATFQTFDGMALNVSLVEKDNDYWMIFDAVEVPASTPAPDKGGLKPNIAKEVEELNAMSSGWAYKIPRFKGTLMSSPLDALLNITGSNSPPSPGH